MKIEYWFPCIAPENHKLDSIRTEYKKKHRINVWIGALWRNYSVWVQFVFRLMILWFLLLIYLLWRTGRNKLFMKMNATTKNVHTNAVCGANGN